jgi:hypothetical protein
MDHDLYWLFNRYWWLLFPLFWAIGQMVKTWQGHNRAKEALNVLKAYAEQGKEPPPELVAVLRQPDKADERKSWQGSYRHYGWIPVFLFGALTCGFVLMGVWRPDDSVPRPAMFFVALIMAGLCVGNLVAMLARQNQDKNQDRIPPP